MRWYHRNGDPPGHRCAALSRSGARGHDGFRQRRFLDPDPLPKDGEVGEGEEDEGHGSAHQEREQQELQHDDEVIRVPEKPVRAGPYRLLRHPNYLVIVLEFLLFPLLLRAPVTLVLFSIANVAALRQRIRIEEEALRKATDRA